MEMVILFYRILRWWSQGPNPNTSFITSCIWTCLFYALLMNQKHSFSRRESEKGRATVAEWTWAAMGSLYWKQIITLTFSHQNTDLVQSISQGQGVPILAHEKRICGVNTLVKARSWQTACGLLDVMWPNHIKILSRCLLILSSLSLWASVYITVLPPTSFQLILLNRLTFSNDYPEHYFTLLRWTQPLSAGRCFVGFYCV